MSHDFWDSDALVRVCGQGTFQQVSALWRDVVGLLEVCCHDAWEHLLEPDQIVSPVVASLCKRKHSFRQSEASMIGATEEDDHQGRWNVWTGQVKILQVMLITDSYEDATNWKMHFSP